MNKLVSKITLTAFIYQTLLAPLAAMEASSPISNNSGTVFIQIEENIGQAALKDADNIQQDRGAHLNNLTELSSADDILTVFKLFSKQEWPQIKGLVSNYPEGSNKKLALDSVVMRFSAIELSTLYEPQPGMRMYF
ncbi:MAG: hypothetical protein COY39_01500 [Alphaproteobacteria bacterium CG_4_10_14_0_8_um_filter_37_21]|nr:MAG: hypothetical protein COY39_01500 [Alphaproteobacteria bacterium CG_4_10_14_0_8_um_filter_37_21]